MATRSNIIIRKKNKEGIGVYQQLYHHYDGYPESGVGEELQEYVNNVPKRNCLSARGFANYLNKQDDSYEIEGKGKLNIHGDIEYLYVVDLDAQKIFCYDIFLFTEDEISDDVDFACGLANKVVTTWSGNKRYESVEIYRSNFSDKFADVIIDHKARELADAKLNE